MRFHSHRPTSAVGNAPTSSPPPWSLSTHRPLPAPVGGESLEDQDRVAEQHPRPRRYGMLRLTKRPLPGLHKGSLRQTLSPVFEGHIRRPKEPLPEVPS